MGANNALPHVAELYIELANNHVTFLAGGTIHGTVHVNLKQPFGESHILVVKLRGKEDVSYTVKIVTTSSSGTGNRRTTSSTTKFYPYAK